MIHATDNDFDKIIDENKLVLVDFYATWCGPCKMESEVLERIDENKNKGFEIVKVNVDENPLLSQKYGVESIPTLVIIKSKEMLKKTIGYMNDEAIQEMMKEFI